MEIVNFFKNNQEIRIFQKSEKKSFIFKNLKFLKIFSFDNNNKKIKCYPLSFAICGD